ncbi:MAG: DegV family protein [Anaerolineae bacterium]
MTSAASVAIVTDSATGIPADLIEKYNIQVVPYWVHMGNESFISGETIDPPEFFRRLRADPELEVRTGVPAIAKFVEVYRSLSTWAKSIVSIHLAGKQSATCNAAELAGQESPLPVVVVDTETTAMAEGFVVLEAARTAAEGGSLEQVVQKAHSVIPNVDLLALLESVSYALKGGRLSSAAGKVGSLLRIQPLVRVAGNKVSLMGQARRRSKGLEALIDKTVSEVKEDPTHLTVHYAEDEEEGRSLLEALKVRINVVESYLARVPVELGVHAGPGSIGVAYYVERENVGLVEQIEQRLERLGAQAKEAIRSRLP